METSRLGAMGFTLVNALQEQKSGGHLPLARRERGCGGVLPWLLVKGLPSCSNRRKSVWHQPLHSHHFHRKEILLWKILAFLSPVCRFLARNATHNILFEVDSKATGHNGSPGLTVRFHGPKSIRREFWDYNKNLGNNFLAFSALLWSQETKQMHLLQDHTASPHQAWIICGSTHTGSFLKGLLLIGPSLQYKPSLQFLWKRSEDYWTRVSSS